jgi:nucleotide-binding universal stress UspA family protein
MSSAEVDRLVERERASSHARFETLMKAFANHPAKHSMLHLKGAPGDAIPEHAQSAGIDTVVMGTVGRTGIPGFFTGNTAETILRRISCSLIAVKPAGFVSPVTLG